jgi:hypothetical protein
LRIEFRASILVRGFSPLSGRVFIWDHAASTPWHSINFPWGSPFGFRWTVFASCSGPAGFRIQFTPAAALDRSCLMPASHSLKHCWCGCLACECAQRAHCVFVSLSSHERRQTHLQRAQRRSRLLVHALPAVIHLRLHWTGPPAPLSRGILFSPPTNPSASRPQPQARRATSSRPLGLPRESTI